MDSPFSLRMTREMAKNAPIALRLLRIDLAMTVEAEMTRTVTLIMIFSLQGEFLFRVNPSRAKKYF